MLSDLRLFWSECHRRFVDTGAIVPSSRQLARSIVEPVRRRPDRPIRVLEVGAGTGVFTRQILQCLRQGDRFEIYEINPRFCAAVGNLLRDASPSDRGIDVQLHAADIRGIPPGARYDFVVCGLPFNNFDPAVVEHIFRLLLGLLNPEGILAYFEYTWLRDLRMRISLSAPQRSRLRAIGSTERYFLSRHEFGHDEVWWNFPPATTHFLRTV